MVCWIHMLIAPFLLLGPAPELQQKRYLLFAGNKEIGNLTVERRQSGEETIYRSENLTTVQVIKKFVLRHEVEAVFRQGALLRSDVKVYLNDKLRESTTTEKQGRGYRILRQGEDPMFLDKPIAWTSLSLYFEEPAAAAEIFSEQYGELFPISEAGNSVYQLDRSGNRTNLYFYKANELVRAEFETLLFTARLELQ